MTSISSERERDQTRWGQEGSLVAALAIAPGLTAVVLAIGAHVFTATRVHSGWGASLFGLALILFFLSVVQQGTPVLLWKGALSASPIDENAPLVRSKIWRLALLANCATLAGLAYWVFAGNRLDRGFWLWAAAVFYFLLALGERPLPGWRNRLNTWWRGIDWRVPLLLAGIMALAIFFRVFRLEGVPAEMTSDHAEKLLDVHDVLGGLHPIFFPRNTGREAVQFYLTAALIRVTPLEISHLALKVGTAI
ncbi:MAG TPA: hypothetical protein VE553_09505, partial [Candidatus Binatia bacterium]|nr:hypothetical protein [Candidatus Binatia bacterium]